MKLALTCLVLFAFIMYYHTEHELLSLLKERYHTLIANLGDDPRWKRLANEAIITGLIDFSKKKGAIGYNVNKGYEIYICLAGDDLNSAMHVLIHELAHTSVTEYDHTSSFWKNFKDLKALAVSLGIYQEVGSHEYCGETIAD